MVRIARYEDLDQILNIVNETIEDLEIIGNYQWSDSYPTKSHFKEDIKNAHLYVFEKNCEVAGFICINTKEDSAYKGLPWNSEGCAIVIHRFAIKRSYQRKTIATKLIKFVEHFALNKKLNYIKVDTNSKNKPMNALFSKLGYQFIGNINLRDLNDPFNCYDKVLEGGNDEVR